MTSATPTDHVCPVCSKAVSELLRLDGGFKLRLRETNQDATIPEEACNGCFARFTEMISEGAQLRAKETAKQQHRISMWRNRTHLIKEARAKMESKNFAEAAVFYEKYLRIIELIYEIEPGKIIPNLFKNKARSREMTLLASVYWDLAKIYDSSGQYREKLVKTIEKIALFAPHSTINTQLNKNISNYLRFAKNRDVFKQLETSLGLQAARCFIATATYGSQNAPEVIALQNFRDFRMEPHWVGRILIRIYYFVSPSIAAVIDRSTLLKRVSALFLRLILKLI